ncbi:hypothetical protein [Sphingomonas desiccabilis]|uniref:Uncharacterized protein n=1 Tax=Sphingomonas desiccabilis TaxID=429134 RepID=A0A4V1QNR1_9SPHN|nr:hypothetical protein [Sphingomonas desiccabilis]MBB3912138.1 hypothetical protein [Sphingomonas desiccabilis]RXZ30301.1 hypothetical protein EO081_13945 [Sphingomonas desiccabilis]
MTSARLGWTLVAASAALAGCALPEARVRSGLERAGLSPRVSACMAQRMVDRLSLAQLRRLGNLPHARDARSLPDFLREVRALGDPEILGVTTSSAALCATGLAN